MNYAEQTLVVAPGPSPRTVRLSTGIDLNIPSEWELLPPGDAGVTRRVKALGPTWTVKTKKGRREFSQGLWAHAEHIRRAIDSMQQTRDDPAYERKQLAARQRRDEKQAEYVEDFHAAVVSFLAFHESYGAIANRLATLVTAHAVPVGSGTVARTQRIPIEQRAESAVIAWMRHQTTIYDQMKIERIRGKRREVRRELAQQSRAVLAKYRAGDQHAMKTCPLAIALRNPPPAANSAQ